MLYIRNWAPVLLNGVLTSEDYQLENLQDQSISKGRNCCRLSWFPVLCLRCRTFRIHMFPPAMMPGHTDSCGEFGERGVQWTAFGSACAGLLLTMLHSRDANGNASQDRPQKTSRSSEALQCGRKVNQNQTTWGWHRSMKWTNRHKDSRQKIPHSAFLHCLAIDDLESIVNSIRLVGFLLLTQENYVNQQCFHSWFDVHSLQETPRNQKMGVVWRPQDTKWPAKTGKLLGGITKTVVFPFVQRSWARSLLTLQARGILTFSSLSTSIPGHQDQIWECHLLKIWSLSMADSCGDRHWPERLVGNLKATRCNRFRITKTAKPNCFMMLPRASQRIWTTRCCPPSSAHADVQKIRCKIQLRIATASATWSQQKGAWFARRS